MPLDRPPSARVPLVPAREKPPTARARPERLHEADDTAVAATSREQRRRTSRSQRRWRLRLLTSLNGSSSQRRRRCWAGDLVEPSVPLHRIRAEPVLGGAMKRIGHAVDVLGPSGVPRARFSPPTFRTLGNRPALGWPVRQRCRLPRGATHLRSPIGKSRTFDRPASPRGADEGACCMTRSTTSDLGRTATYSHRRLAHGLDEVAAAEEVGGSGLSFLRLDPRSTSPSPRSTTPTRRLAVGLLRDPEGTEDAALAEALVGEARRHGEGRPR
jgi:hypothetical protein